MSFSAHIAVSTWLKTVNDGETMSRRNHVGCPGFIKYKGRRRFSPFHSKAKSAPETDSVNIPRQFMSKWNSFGACSSANRVECDTTWLASHSHDPVYQTSSPNTFALCL